MQKAIALPAVGYVRLTQILEIFPISKSAWWEGCRSGVFPKPVKLGPRTSAWRVEDIRALMERINTASIAYDQDAAMSYLVLHMDKFKRESLRGIQSHNRRERRSHSNPDIRHEKSGENYDLHQPELRDYARAVQARIEALNLPKAVRKDAVVLCGLIVTSNLPFFARLPPEEQRRFFEESRDFLARFVGQEDVISAMIHMDEKTPHIHFLHVPVTPDGRLSANAIYTRESLRRLQSELPEHLQKCGFRIERGVEQVPGARRILLNTREFKQEKEQCERIAADNVKVLRHALDTLYAANELEEHLKGKIKEYEKQAREAELYLSRNEELPEATLFNFKTVLAQARRVIEEQKKALAEKAILEGRKEVVDGLLAERNRELKEQARRIDRLLRNYEELKAQKLKADKEARTFKEFIVQPEEKPRFEQFLANKQEEVRREEMERQKRLASLKTDPAFEDDGPSCSPR